MGRAAGRLPLPCVQGRSRTPGQECPGLWTRRRASHASLSAAQRGPNPRARARRGPPPPEAGACGAGLPGSWAGAGLSRGPAAAVSVRREGPCSAGSLRSQPRGPASGRVSARQALGQAGARLASPSCPVGGGRALGGPFSAMDRLRGVGRGCKVERTVPQTLGRPVRRGRSGRRPWSPASRLLHGRLLSRGWGGWGLRRAFCCPFAEVWGGWL